LPPLACAADWLEFRGPTAQGHAPVDANVPLKWSATENVKWKTPIAGEGWSSPVVCDGVAYLTAAAPQGDDGSYALQLILIDVATGEIQRTSEAFLEVPEQSPKIHAKNSHASPTPLIEGDLVYVHFGHQGTACFRRDGELVWRNDSFRYEPVHGNGGSPVIAGDKLIFSCDGEKDPFILALDKATGEVAWRYERPSDAEKKFSFSTPLLIEVAGREQLMSPGSNLVVSLDPQTGEEIWRCRYDGFPSWHDLCSVTD
ncbi:MAG: PQQ-binding-like beta-propeller repeat protein, partial [Planctomycetales bacterium]|nr:PQQ-binding-like beta-propeller repeat protein [Planctomycetales bacterium]